MLAVKSICTLAGCEFGSLPFCFPSYFFPLFVFLKLALTILFVTLCVCMCLFVCLFSVSVLPLSNMNVSKCNQKFFLSFVNGNSIYLSNFTCFHWFVQTHSVIAHMRLWSSTSKTILNLFPNLGEITSTIRVQCLCPLRSNAAVHGPRPGLDSPLALGDMAC